MNQAVKLQKIKQVIDLSGCRVNNAVRLLLEIIRKSSQLEGTEQLAKELRDQSERRPIRRSEGELIDLMSTIAHFNS